MDPLADRALAPLIVGFVGKRDVGDHSEALRRTLRSTFDRLDCSTPHSPKILLSALASGADTIAAEEALARSNWCVVSPLPLPVDLYAQDFDATGEARLRQILEREKVRVHLLGPLIDPRTGTPFTIEALSRRPDHSNPDRTDHYEQAGLFIAQSCALLIAALPASEKPDRVGGTARIVEARLAGQVDTKARDIIQRSEVLRAPGLLEALGGGPVWRIDLVKVDAIDTQTQPFEVLLPAASVPANLSKPAKLKASLRVLQRVNDFNWRCARMPYAAWQERVIGRAQSRTGDAAAHLLQLRLALSAIQQKMKAAVRRSVIALASLFVLAVLAFEIYVACPTDRMGSIALTLNILIIAVALILNFGARIRRWTTYAEDYRAAAEALRVQIAWWDAGLRGRDDRVDHILLRDAVGSRNLIRAGLTNLINAAFLIHGPPCNAVRLPEVEDSWVKGQEKYYEARAGERHRALKLVDVLCWNLFFGTIGLALYLWLLSLGGHITAPPRVLGSALVLLLVLAMAGVLLYAQDHGPVLTHMRRGRAAGALLGFLLGSLGGAWLHDALDESARVSLRDAAHHVLVTLSVVLAAVAGAIRFVSEKLSWEAEARSYIEAMGLFRRAYARVETLRNDTTRNTAENEEQRRKLIRELGEEALAEHEAWVRAHRERPLEPLFGG